MATISADGIPVRVWVRALSAEGQAAANLGEYDRARALLEQSLNVYRELGNLVWICEALTCLAYTAGRQGDLAYATALFEECLEVSRQAHSPWHLGLALNNLADAVLRQGNVGRAAALLQEALPVARTTGNYRLLADVLSTMGMVARQQEDAPHALAFHRQALALVQESDTGILVAELLVQIGWALGAQGLQDQAAPLLESAARLFGAAVARCEIMGYAFSAADQTEQDQIVAQVRTVLGEEGFAVAWEVGRALSLQEAVAEALGEVD
jgi:tetratricopeptide (TPR) repeat protein